MMGGYTRRYARIKIGASVRLGEIGGRVEPASKPMALYLDYNYTLNVHVWSTYVIHNF